MTEHIFRQSEAPSEVLAWLDDFSARVRNVDYAGAKKLFNQDIFGFGTKAQVYRNLDDWHQSQWTKVWPATTEFKFDLETLQVLVSADGSLCCVVCEWSSKGFREDGTHFPRQGRSSIVLANSDANSFGWIGVHSHFSMPPT